MNKTFLLIIYAITHAVCHVEALGKLEKFEKWVQFIEKKSSLCLKKLTHGNEHQ